MKLLFFLFLLASISVAAWHKKYIKECDHHCLAYGFALYKNEGVRDCCANYIDDDAEMKDWLCHRNNAVCIYI